MYDSYIKDGRNRTFSFECCRIDYVIEIRL